MQSSTGAQSEFVSQVLAIRQKFGIQLYVTSRTIQEIARKAPDASQMEICARDEDMRCSLANILKTGPLLSNRPDLQKRALSKILQIADGIFLLAVLYAKHLASFELMKNLSKALDGLRSTSDPYSVVYASTMQRIQDNGGGDTNMALTIICWLLLARRPLRLREMLHALAIDESTPSLDEENVPTVAQITHACAGLVDVDRSNDTIGLFHKTFHEYLDKNQSTWFPLGHQTIGKTCVGYLSLQVFADGPCPESNNGLQSSNSLEKFRPLVERVRQYPLYEYSCFYWADHVRGNAAESEVEVLRFLKDSKKVSASCQDGREYHPDTTGLHVALENLLLQSSIRHLENNRLDVNATDHRGRSPLSYAVKLGNLRVVEMLLERGANSNFEDYPQHTRSALTPLARAASHGSTAIMQALFSRHAHVDLRDRFGRTALSFAAAAGEEPALRLLLDHGARPDQSDSSGRTIISYAAEAGSDTIVTLLLRLGVEADPIDDHRGTPLIYAARNGSAATMSILIAEGANVDASDWEQESPLSLAVRSNMETTAQSLIFRGAKVKTLNNSLQSPLHHAAIIENVRLIKLLIDAGSNKEAKDNEGLTPLGYAAKAGSVATVRSLLSHGCNADSIDHKGRSWLSYAAGSGSAEMVRLLLDHGAQTTQALRSARSGPIYYVLEAASQNQESVEILKILLERGVNANRTMAQMYPQPPLIDALKILSPLGPLTKQLIKLLLDHGANTQWKDGQGKSVLMYANHQEGGIRDLLRQYGAS
ncbi:hypothetical protein D6D08_08223 [Aureobasidium pullulans]|nr:hypothetical protein D6D08_08223 [Aureobasidium pullulans]